MRYSPKAAKERFDQLGATQAYILGEHNLIQWHADDYTLVAQATYELMGTYDPGTETFTAWKTQRAETIPSDWIDIAVQTMARDRGTFPFLLEQGNRYYAVRDIEPIKDERTFPDEVIDLRQQFIDCMVGLEQGQEGTEDHIAQVKAFQAGFEGFLDRYKQQSIGTFVAYVAELGVEHGQALIDLVRLNSMYL